MAMIHLLSFGSKVKGVAVVAGAPYGCNAIVGKKSEHACGYPAKNHGPSNPTKYKRIEQYLQQRAADGLIDPLKVQDCVSL